MSAVGVLAVVLPLVIRDDDDLRVQPIEQLGAAAALAPVMGGDEHVGAQQVAAELGAGEHAPPAADLKITGKDDLEGAELGDHDEAEVVGGVGLAGRIAEVVPLDRDGTEVGLDGACNPLRRVQPSGESR